MTDHYEVEGIEEYNPTHDEAVKIHFSSMFLLAAIASFGAVMLGLVAWGVIRGIAAVIHLVVGFL